jgi:hypothetical protein
VERGGSGIEYERCTGCSGLMDVSYIRDGSVREDRAWRGAGVGEPPSLLHGRTRGDGTTPCSAPLKCLFADVVAPALLLLEPGSSQGATRGEGTTGWESWR